MVTTLKYESETIRLQSYRLCVSFSQEENYFKRLSVSHLQNKIFSSLKFERKTRAVFDMILYRCDEKPLTVTVSRLLPQANVSDGKVWYYR